MAGEDANSVLSPARNAPQDASRDHRGAAADQYQRGSYCVRIQSCLPQQFLYLRPEPQGQGSLRPTLASDFLGALGAGAESP